LFAFQGERGLLADAIEQAATQLGFQGSHRMADGGLGDEYFFGRRGKTAGAGQ